ncbi:GtrA family protein [Oceanobacillus piezotolerans]|uniref:GtrA family protein n=1 Tax=Oceanobacillus piezotolerans TaxID=2448030 RepID=A0A498DJY2_9BACI|nr:GtrA family protein [Oceanobacillus piezotolerans]RLL42735.1 GtrA family protein [Oceanobacillus piezotolerans]
MSPLSKNREIIIQALQFSLIGGLNALIDIGSLNLMLLFWPTENSLYLLLFNTISYTLAVANSYLWNSSWTFKNTSSKQKQEVFFFVLQALASLVISNIVFVGGSFLLGISPIPAIAEQNIAKGAAMIISSGASFFFMRYFVFRKNRSKFKVKIRLKRSHPMFYTSMKKAKIQSNRFH